METESINSFQEYLNQVQDFLVEDGVRIVFYIFIIIAGFWLIKKITKAVSNRLLYKKVSPSISSFLTSMVNAALKIALLITMAPLFGVETTSFVAVIGAITLAMGLALQGSLANFAGGFLILTFKPFEVGDFISAQGYSGIVKEIQVFQTTIVDFDKSIHIVPNGILSNGSLTNWSENEHLRLKLKIWLGFDADIELAEKLAMDIMLAHPLVQDNPKPRTGLAKVHRDGVELWLIPFVTLKDYRSVQFEVQKQVLDAYQKHGISMAYAQLGVHGAGAPVLAAAQGFGERLENGLG